MPSFATVVQRRSIMYNVDYFKWKYSYLKELSDDRIRTSGEG